MAIPSWALNLFWPKKKKEPHLLGWWIYQVDSGEKDWEGNPLPLLCLEKGNVVHTVWLTTRRGLYDTEPSLS